MKRIYLDWASTAPPLPQAIEAHKKIACAYFGNPSSLHREGSAARLILEEARALVAQTAGALPQEVVFTSGATEANNLVVTSILKKTLSSPSQKRDARIVVSGIEHASVWEPVQALKAFGFDIAVVPAGSDGIIGPEALVRSLDEKTTLVLLMTVNNETGAIQPVKECAAAVKDYTRGTGRKIHVHTDAVQAFGKIWLSFGDLGVDSACLSAHKLGGPRGVGALLVRKQAAPDFIFSGGTQEHSLRPGTENLPAIHAFAVAAKARIDAIDARYAGTERLMARLISSLRSINGVMIMPETRGEEDKKRFSPFILTVCIPPVPGEVLVRSLDDSGFALSTGSACHAGRKKYTRVLEAQGVPKRIAACALRISLGPETTEKEIESLIAALTDCVPLLVKISRKNT